MDVMHHYSGEDEPAISKTPHRVAKIGSDRIDRVRDIGTRVMSIMGSTAAFLKSHEVYNGVLRARDSSPLSIGRVKDHIRRWLAEAELEAPAGIVFAVGHDSGVPHEPGRDDGIIPVGATIVFDLFPRDIRTGLFFDVTRTWCMEFAPMHVERAYGDILDTFDMVMRQTRMNDRCAETHRMACEFLEQRGHPTRLSDPMTRRGFVHALGHGVGINIHERPFIMKTAEHGDIIPGNSVVAIEPGLYYPDDGGFGVRYENCCWMNPSTGRFELLADFSSELVLPVMCRSKA